MRSGESLKEIVSYWWPELISVALLVYIPPLFDTYLISQLGSVTTLGALSSANNMIHTLIKFSEAIPAAAIAIIGRHNGAREYDKVGKDLGDTFWTVFLCGCIIFFFLFLYASTIYVWLGVPEKMIERGVPFLRLRAVGIFLTFIIVAFLSFIRGVKNTRVPMVINIIGSIIFMTTDYMLVLGKCGFSPMGLIGSALATILQYTAMISCAVAYILWNPDYKKYFPRVFFMMFSLSGALRLINLSWPIVIDKISLSFAYVWLLKMIAPMGKYAIGSLEIIKNLERLAFLPALAFARIILFLVSNRLGAQDVLGARSNIKKSVFMAMAMVFCTLSVLCMYAPFFVSIFDVKGKLTSFTSSALPLISSLVIFDLVQVILAGALRGAGDVKTVMYGRFIVCFFFFIPLSFFFSYIPFTSPFLRFVLTYSLFYISNALMGCFFFYRIVGNYWYQKKIG